MRRAETIAIWPKDRARFSELRSFKQELRVEHGHVVRIQQQHLLKGGVNDRVRLELPSPKDSNWLLSPDRVSVDTLDIERRDEKPHLLIEFLSK
jgi:hypothetical protein